MFDFPSPSQGDRVQELESRVDLPIRRVRQMFDFQLMQEKLPNFRFSHVFGGTHEKRGELARIEQVIASRGRAEVPQGEIFSHTIMETAHRKTSW